MTCRAWLEGSCNCEQPCNEEIDNSFMQTYIKHHEVTKPVIIPADQLDQIKLQFGILAGIYSGNFPEHIVWEHFKVVGELLGVDVNRETSVLKNI